MSNSPISVTRLLGLGLTPGKLRGLQRISNDNGTLTMVATDQNSSMISMIRDSLKKKGIDREPTFDEIVEAKIILAESLSKNASGVLVDGYYGVWNSVASFNIPKTVGILVRVEQSGGGKNKVNAPLGGFEPGWSVEKIKGIGADAVKLLAQYEPPNPIVLSTNSNSSNKFTKIAKSMTSSCCWKLLLSHSAMKRKTARASSIVRQKP